MAIDDFYNGRSVFITGASGFMGKVLLEKLLYGCPSLERIYVLLRPKKCTSVMSRLDLMLSSLVFNRIRSKDPKLLKKVVAINGDVSLENLGMDAADRRRLIEEVSVVFHCAASLKLEGKLKELVNINLCGTKRIIDLCYDMPKLKVLIHLSTAFCHVDIAEMDEQIYSSNVNPEDVIEIIEWLDDESIEILTPRCRTGTIWARMRHLQMIGFVIVALIDFGRLLGSHPNCYTFTKRLAETLVDSHYPALPVAVVRPSIVTPAWKEPIPGWVDNLNGPMGLLVGAGKGVIRTMHCRGELVAEVIPVDYAINAIIGFSWLTAASQKRFKQTPVMNITESKSISVTWGELVERGKRICHENPFETMLWYPDGNIHSSWIIHTLCVVFFHWIPALLIDALMTIARQKTFMIKIQNKITEGLNVLQYFTTRQWVFHSRVLDELKTSMTEHDKNMFPITTEGLDITSYLTSCILGARQYLMKEDPKSIPRQRNVLKMMYILDRTIKWGLYLFIVYLVVRYFNILNTGLVYTKYNVRVQPLSSSS